MCNPIFKERQERFPEADAAERLIEMASKVKSAKIELFKNIIGYPRE